MGLFKRFISSMSEPSKTNGVPDQIKIFFLGNEFVVHSKAYEQMSDEHSKEMYDMALASIAQAEEAMYIYLR